MITNANISSTIRNLKLLYKKAEATKIKKKSIKKIKDVDFLIKNEWLIKKKLIKKDILKKINKKINKKITYKNIFRPKDCSFIKKSNYNEIKKKDNKFWLNFPKLNDADFKKGINTWKKKTSYVIIKNPHFLAREIIEISKNKKIKKILSGYYDKCKFKLTFVKVILSFANNIVPVDTQLFHNDFDSARLVKVFIYFDDVLSLNNGPTQFIESSNIYKGKNYKIYEKLPMRMDEKLVKNNFKKSKIKSFMGKAGDGLFLNTGMLHRGKKPKFKNRNVLILSYCIHDEINSTQKFTFQK